MKQFIKTKLLHMLMGKEAMSKQVAVHAYWAGREPLTSAELAALRIKNNWKPQ